MEAEIIYLKSKIDNLFNFFDTDVYFRLDEDDRQIYQEQYEAMSIYLNCLELRARYKI